jgi:hypothetical protein
MCNVAKHTFGGRLVIHVLHGENIFTDNAACFRMLLTLVLVFTSKYHVSGWWEECKSKSQCCLGVHFVMNFTNELFC